MNNGEIGGEILAVKLERNKLTAQLAEAQKELQRQSFAGGNVQIHWSEEKQRLESKLALAVATLKKYATLTTLHSIRNGYGVFNSPGPELAKDAIAKIEVE